MAMKLLRKRPAIEDSKYRADRDPVNVWNGEKFVFTLRKISSIVKDFPIPPAFEDKMDTPIDDLTHGALSAVSVPNPFRVIFLTVYDSKRYSEYVQYAKEGCILVSNVQFKDADGTEIPIIYMDSIWSVRLAYDALGHYIKNVFPMPTIGVTGSIGKTTTVLFMQYIFAEHYKVFVTGRNRNVANEIVHRMITNYGPDYEFHIQETGGGSPKLVERSARILDADAFCITNIYPHHLDKYGDLEGVLEDKSSYDRLAKPGVFCVVNWDDDMLRNFNYRSRPVSCGIQHTEADYVATDIRQNGAVLEMNIIHNKETVPIRIHIPGLHNAYNALFAFAMAKEWGLTNEEIQNGFLKYTSGPIRQSLREVSGRFLYIDCFNVSADSIKSCLHTLDGIEIPEKNRRIAVLGGENALGDQVYSVNFEIGLQLAQYHADEFIFVGKGKDASAEDLNYYGHAHALYEGAMYAIKDRKVSYYDNLADAAEKLARETKPGDAILFKGIFRLPFFSIIDRAFGTSYTIYNPNFKGIAFKENGFLLNYYAEFDGCNILRRLRTETEIKIPTLVNDYPIFRIGRGVFADDTTIKTIDFGRTLRNIGKEAFRNCTGLHSLDVPANVIHIESEAFEGCKNLRKIVLRGVEHIEAGAFRGCTSLALVSLPKTCQTIEVGAFDNCPHLVLQVHAGSYGYQYAVEHNIATTVYDSDSAF